jgi:uncharacterized phage protein gp47/JayE
MSFDAPSLSTLVLRAENDLTANAEGALRRSDARVLARVHAGAVHGLYGYQSWIARQILPDTCDEEMLVDQANLRLNQPRKPAVFATGFVSCTGSVGAAVAAGVLMQTVDERIYHVTAPAILNEAGVAVVAIAALLEGAAGNVPADAQMNMVSPVFGVSEVTTVLAPGVAGGADQESITSLRQRLLRSYRVVPHGGNRNDYETWALEFPGVTRAWCVPLYVGDGTVGVLVMRDEDVDPFPNEQACKEIFDYIEERRPVTAEVYVIAPHKKVIDFEIRLLPDEPAVRLAVEASIKELFAVEGMPGGQLLRSHLEFAISAAEGEIDHTLVKPSEESIPIGPLEIAVCGEIKWL